MAVSLRILVVTTKPPWPPIDGGRVVVLNTIDALAAVGHDITLVSPIDPSADAAAVGSALADRCRPQLVLARPRGARGVLITSLLRGRPVTVVRHQLPAVTSRVKALVRSSAFDVVQAEQLQAVPQTAPAVARGIPLVYRAHNVESELWSFTASFGRQPGTALLRREARRVATAERDVLHRAAASVALTDLDAAPLRRTVGPGPRIDTVPIPFPAELPAGTEPLGGRPAVVTLASPTWVPSRATILQVAASWWPRVRHLLPEAVLHVFGGVDGGEHPGVVWHGAPDDSRRVFAPDAVMAIPVRHPTGVPVKALEAWARGVPLLVSAETAAALGGEDGRDLLAADGAEAFAAVLERLAGDDALRRQLVDGGRARLRERHDPAAVAARLTGIYLDVAEDQRLKIKD